MSVFFSLFLPLPPPSANGPMFPLSPSPIGLRNAIKMCCNPRKGSLFLPLDTKVLKTASFSLSLPLARKVGWGGGEGEEKSLGRRGKEFRPRQGRRGGMERQPASLLKTLDSFLFPGYPTSLRRREEKKKIGRAGLKRGGRNGGRMKER